MINNKLFIIMVRITKLVFNLTNEEVNIVKKVFSITFSLLKKNGTKFTINYLKQSRLLITRYLCHKPIYRNDHFISTKRGFPVKFIFLKKYIDSGNTNKIKFVLTLMNISRTITLKKNDKVEVDLSTITDPSPRRVVYTIPGWFIEKWISQHNLKLTQHQYTTKDFFISLKAGPHGPSILSILETVKWLRHSQLESMKALLDNDEFFVKYIGRLYSFCKHNLFRIPRGSALFDIDQKEENYPQITGKISLIQDPEYKMRLVAISDYLSQVILKPIHTQLLQLLKKLPCDRTYTQNPKHEWVGPGKFHSLDLSAATDRFPILLQQKLLQFLFEPEKVHKLIGSYWFAEHWKRLISQREFLWEDKLIKYAVGQPMGSYSSWAAFTLTHHLVVAWAAYHVYGDSPFTNYIILGDDIVIKDDKVARNYRRIMNKLGVSISPHKTHVSTDTYEFAKRWIRYRDSKFIELSPLPLKGIALNITNPFIVFTIMFDYFVIKGNLCLVRGSLRSLIGNLYQGISFREVVKDPKIKSKTKVKTKVKILTFRKPYLLQRLKLLDFGMRYSLGLCTYDYIRSLFCNFSAKSEWYPIPGCSTIPLEVRRVLSESVKDSVKSGISSILKLSEQFNKYLAILGLEDWNIIGSFPIYYGIRNYLNRVEDVSNSWTSESFNLYELSKEVNFLDFSELAIWNRNYHNTILEGSKLWLKAFQTLDRPLEQQIDYSTMTDMSVEKHLQSQRWFIEIRAGLLKFNQFSPIESGKFRTPPKQMMEAFRTMAKRHGYAFLK
jgi:hypothetical protein